MTETPLTLEAVYAEHFSFVWRAARHLRVSDASVDDVVQDVFVVIHRRLADFDGRSHVRAWIFGILTRVVASHRRRARRKDAPLESLDYDDSGEERFFSTLPPPSEGAEHSQALQLIERLLANLSEDKREVLMLSRLYEMTVPEIADCTGTNLNTMYSRLRAAEQEFDALVRAFHAQGATA